jgi:hypothetical protein
VTDRPLATGWSAPTLTINECFDTSTDVVTNCTHVTKTLALRMVERPVVTLHTRHVRTFWVGSSGSSSRTAFPRPDISRIYVRATIEVIPLSVARAFLGRNSGSRSYEPPPFSKLRTINSLLVSGLCQRSESLTSDL